MSRNHSTMLYSLSQGMTSGKFSFGDKALDIILYYRHVSLLPLYNIFTYRLVMWIRWKSGYSPEDHQNFHRSAVSSASDLMLARSVTKAFPQFDQTNLYVTSLDHSIWFHTDCDSREWHLHVAECDHSKGGQALTSLW